MALFTVLANKLVDETLPLKCGNDTIQLGNSNITVAQFEYSTNQL